MPGQEEIDTRVAATLVEALDVFVEHSATAPVLR
jgi:hypothetical protein